MLALLALLLLGQSPSTEPPIALDELAGYRLTAATFAPFTTASRAIGAVTRSDPKFAHAPLFTREVAVSGEAPVMAAGLRARLENDPALTAALRDAKITAREYTLFALTLFAARLAQGFVKAGVIREVPDGPAADNIAFVNAHDREIAAVFKELGVEE